MRFVGKFILLIFLVQGLIVKGWSQECTALGQTPGTAFPLCGSSIFTQKNVPLCSNTSIPSYCQNLVPTVQAIANPYWYRFTCYTSGSLGFLITPLNTANENYDWQLFDVTDRYPEDVLTDRRLVITNNWSGTYGPTGASITGSLKFQCGSDPVANINPFAPMPELQQGHDYLLLVSHFLSNSTSEIGYTISFQGGTANIVNPSVSKIKNIRAICEGQQIGIKLTSRVLCSSVAADGSDFNVTGTVNRNVVSATGYGCKLGFETDSIILNLDNILTRGNFTITAQVGNDNNTVTDYCANAMPVGEKATITFVPPTPIPMDSIMPVVCIQDTLKLIFKRPVLCNSIAPDGSDFTVTGPVPVVVKKADGLCTDGQTTIVRIILAKPIRVNGTFTITLKNGNDGNSLVDECGLATPAGATLSFTTKNITTADFIADVRAGCKFDTVYFRHNAYGGTTQWLWRIDGGASTSTLQNYELISKDYGPHSAKLLVTNGNCSDTVTNAFVFADHTVKASFFALADTLCPNDTLHFTDQSTANTVAWQWSFGNGVTSILQFPAAQTYPLTGRRSSYTAKLIAQNIFNCSDTAYKKFTVLASCYIAVPTAFTPNGDGLNDYLYPLNAFKADNFIFKVFNHFGQIIFETKDWNKKWDGRINGLPQPGGTYVWLLDYVDRDNGQKVSLKGTTVLIR